MNYSNVFKSMVLLSLIFVIASCKKENKTTDPVAEQAARFTKGKATFSSVTPASTGVSGIANDVWTGLTLTATPTGDGKSGTYALADAANTAGADARQTVWGNNEGGAWAMTEVGRVTLTPTGKEAVIAEINVTESNLTLTFDPHDNYKPAAGNRVQSAGEGNWTFNFTY